MKRPSRNKPTKSLMNPRHGLVALPEAVGKTVQELTVANSPDDSGIDIFFEDQTDSPSALKLRSN